jgi:hypothetical protein
MNVLTFTIVMWLGIIALKLMMDSLPEIISEIRMDRRLKKTAALAEESRKRYEQARLAADTIPIKVVKLPQTKYPVHGAHRRVKA